MTFSEATYAIHRYFAERNIPIDGLTVIINLQDSRPAMYFDRELKTELAALMMNPSLEKILDIRDFKLHGIRVKIESPLHEVVT